MSSFRLFVYLCSFAHLVRAHNDTIIHGWVAEPDGRGTWSILWSSLATISLCTWSVLHMPVPKYHQRWRLALRRCKWFSIAMVAPEVIMCVSLEGYIESRTDLQNLKYYGGPQWTMVHAQFLNMEGFGEDHKPDKNLVDDEPRYNSEQLIRLIRDGMLSEPPISHDELQSRSKSDWLIKVISIFQILYFASQTLFRSIQHMRVTSLEILVVAFIFCSVLSYTFSWSKPQDVEYPVIIILSKPPKRPESVQAEPSPNGSQLEIAEQHIPHQNIPQKNLTLQSSVHQQNLPEQNVPEQNLPEQNLPEQNLPEQNLPEQNPPEQSLPEENLPEQNVPQQDILQQGVYQQAAQEQGVTRQTTLHDPDWLEIPIPSAYPRQNAGMGSWSGNPIPIAPYEYDPLDVHPRIAGRLNDWLFGKDGIKYSILCVILASIFGSLHCLAWNSPFPSPAERLVWRAAAIACIALPPLILWHYRHSTARCIFYPRCVTMKRMMYFLCGLYLVARLMLLVVAFTALRELPAETYKTVNWARYLPNFAA